MEKWLLSKLFKYIGMALKMRLADSLIKRREIILRGVWSK